MWLALALVFTPAEANAQGGAVVTCAKKIWEFVGKPLTAGAAERAGGLVAEYFADKLKGGAKSGAPSAPPTAPVSIGRNDIEALQRRGLNDCQIRQALDAMYGVAQPYVPPRGYSAQAYAAQPEQPERRTTCPRRSRRCSTLCMTASIAAGFRSAVSAAHAYCLDFQRRVSTA
jgi:hypothetical protein